MGIFDPQGISSSPTGQTTQSSGLSSWVQPYVSDYLNKAQQLASSQATPELLNQSYIGAANLQLPSGFARGAALAEAGGQGSLSTAPIALGYGQRGAQYGEQGTKYGEMGSAMGQVAARAGDIYAQQATSPEAIQAYMSPYMQGVVDWQKQQAERDFAKQTPQLKAQAAGQGAFGGSRLAIQQSEAQRAYQNQLAGIEALGRQQAYDQARQAQQYAAQLGLQGQQVGMQGQQLGLAGLQTAMQGQQVGLQGVGGAQAGYSGATAAGGTLGNIAAQEAQARLAALALKNQFGMQQQLWPYQQLQFQQGMLSGLPIGSTTQQTYTSSPSSLAQMAGLGSTLLGGYGLYKSLTGGATGGLSKDFKPVKAYADGGDVQDISIGDGRRGFVGIDPFEMEQINAINKGAMPMYPGMETPQLGAGLPGLMPTPAPQADNAAYVNSLYQNMFGRQADQAGYQHNLDLLNAGKIDQQGLANAFMNSAEAQAMPRRDYKLMGAGLAGLGLANALRG